MRRVLKGLVFGLVGLALAACAQVWRHSGTASLAGAPADALRLASYNVHYIVLSQADGPWSRGDWERRKRPLDAAFKALDADLVAFQEMESFQNGSDGSVNLARDWLLAENPGYAATHHGDWRQVPQTQPIFYRADRLAPLDEGWFFFSDTPDVIYSRTFNGSWPAFASWARFRDLQSGEELRVVNVHFEFKSGSNRRLSAALVGERLAAPLAAGERVMLVGDLNARLGATTVEILEAAGWDFLPVAGATYHFNRGLNLFGAIDHIALAGPVAALGPPVVLRQQFEGEWPTDHYPLVADLALSGPP
ncbi:endonuclease/exonuclease/phosphatase family protein [Dinoroseobacter sp. S124A]|uniref:endonuclease/exonuclease/phosphatase family protein n=1 Tax=Dinoroseobacter sp. S124A TaxID=3415128 RepID=UPI003C7B1A82